MKEKDKSENKTQEINKLNLDLENACIDVQKKAREQREKLINSYLEKKKPNFFNVPDLNDEGKYEYENDILLKADYWQEKDKLELVKTNEVTDTPKSATIHEDEDTEDLADVLIKPLTVAEIAAEKHKKNPIKNLSDDNFSSFNENSNSIDVSDFEEVVLPEKKARSIFDEKTKKIIEKQKKDKTVNLKLPKKIMIFVTLFIFVFSVSSVCFWFYLSNKKDRDGKIFALAENLHTIFAQHKTWNAEELRSLSDIYASLKNGASSTIFGDSQYRATYDILNKDLTNYVAKLYQNMNSSDDSTELTSLKNLALLASFIDLTNIDFNTEINFDLQTYLTKGQEKIFDDMSNLDKNIELQKERLNILQTTVTIQNTVKTMIKDLSILEKNGFFDKIRILNKDLDSYDKESISNLVKELKSFDLKDLSPETQTYIKSYIDNLQSLEIVGDLNKIEKYLSDGRFYTVKSLLDSLLQKNTNLLNNKLLQSRYNDLLEKMKSMALLPLVKYEGKIYAYNIKPLVIDVKEAKTHSDYRDVSNHNFTANAYNELLEQLYKAGFVLIDPRNLHSDLESTHSLLLPADKKALILYLNDFTNEENDSNFVGEFKLSDSGLHAYDVKNQQVDEASAIILTEKFIHRHPDFSFDGARPVLRLNSKKIFDKEAEVLSYLGQNNYTISLSHAVLGFKNSNSEVEFSNLLNGIMSKIKNIEVSSYFLQLIDKKNFTKSYNDILAKNGINTVYYWSDDPQWQNREHTAYIGLLDMRPYILYIHLYSKLFDDDIVYNKLIEDMHYWKRS